MCRHAAFQWGLVQSGLSLAYFFGAAFCVAFLIGAGSFCGTLLGALSLVSKNGLVLAGALSNLSMVAAVCVYADMPGFGPLAWSPDGKILASGKCDGRRG